MHAFSLLLLISLFVSCSSPKDYNSLSTEKEEFMTTFHGHAMTMSFKIIVGHPLSDKQIKEITSVIANTFAFVDKTHNKWNPTSEISTLNNLKAGIRISISNSLEFLLNETDRIVRLSHGRFDPTIEPLQQLWKNALQNGTIPSNNAIEKTASSIGWHQIHFGNGIFYKDNDATQLDLGGIAKGYCIDWLIENIGKLGHQNLFVEWGGEIRAAGIHPENRSWTIYISRLGNTNPKEAIDTIYLKNQAIATSGDYLQNWPIRDEGSTTTYFHIFDPKTLRPLEATHTSVASVSVVAASCAFADGLATSAMLFPTIAEAKAWLQGVKQQYPEVSFWIVSREHTLKHRDKENTERE